MVGVGVTAADEPDDLSAVGRGVADGEHESVAEGVDEPAGRGVLGQAGREELVLGGAVAAQVAGEGGPAAGGIAGSGVGVGGEVEAAEPVGEVGLRP